MGFLDKFSTGASAASSAVGAVGGVASLLFGGSQQRKQARYQMRLQQQLNAQQQQYARENAATAYQRQRDLTRDTALLQKTGQQQAGLSTAGDFGGSAASVSPIAPPSAGSAPSLPDPNVSMLAGIQAIQASANSLVQNRTAQAQAEGLELQNDIMRQSLPQKVAGAQGEGMSKYAAGKKATATLPTDIQQSKDTANLTNNELWKSENDAAFASANAFNNANTLLAQSLQAHELYEKAKQDKSMSAEQLQLFKDTYDFAVQSARQNVINLKKQGALFDAQAFASRKQGEYSEAMALGQRTLNDFEKRTLEDKIKRVHIDTLKADVERRLAEMNLKPQDVFDMAAKRIASLPEKVSDWKSDDWFKFIVDFAPAMIDSVINVASRVIPAAKGK
nr:MAG TPA: hypothetical protein [Microviridae sp.]